MYLCIKLSVTKKNSRRSFSHRLFCPSSLPLIPFIRSLHGSGLTHSILCNFLNPACDFRKMRTVSSMKKSCKWFYTSGDEIVPWSYLLQRERCIASNYVVLYHKQIFSLRGCDSHFSNQFLKFLLFVLIKRTAITTIFFDAVILAVNNRRRGNILCSAFYTVTVVLVLRRFGTKYCTAAAVNRSTVN